LDQGGQLEAATDLVDDLLFAQILDHGLVFLGMRCSGDGVDGTVRRT
jgi:hypothetical protein